jgi:hypothetical protein
VGKIARGFFATAQKLNAPVGQFVPPPPSHQIGCLSDLDETYGVVIRSLPKVAFARIIKARRIQ